MLYPRSQIVTAAKAYGLQAIDLVSHLTVSLLEHRHPQTRTLLTRKVCVNYKDEAALQEESEEGRRLGFDGKVSRFVQRPHSVLKLI